jgi:dihydropteroate synthase
VSSAFQWNKTRTLIMGVLNVTPDSFSDGGKFLDVDAAVAHGQAIIAAGADIIDIGGESTRPGSEPISPEEELRRVVPVIQELTTHHSPLTISVDTTKAAVAEQALFAGARIVNDISGLRADGRMAAVVREAGAGVVLMHMQGTPQTMQQNPHYRDVVAEVREFLAERIAFAETHGIKKTQIAVDPGIGFGKTVQQNLQLLAELDSLRGLGCPIVAGTSRKSFIGKTLAREPHERLWGTAATVAWAVAHGAGIVRVHDVAEMRDVVRMVEAIQASKKN